MFFVALPLLLIVFLCAACKKTKNPLRFHGLSLSSSAAAFAANSLIKLSHLV
ncbi:hypothetical protein GARC_3413 [Paraglaciecola arctica BSs20135]|uniref:Uncharacterized protein n=1 Tax=Paraglaciecola arctica BSs20135 TaxID=493475 RepID=K6Y8X3_9ALTE|nr:hypothetical protein GARC_3413 [Paraglaciecola arctica BSs20135]